MLVHLSVLAVTPIRLNQLLLPRDLFRPSLSISVSIFLFCLPLLGVRRVVPAESCDCMVPHLPDPIDDRIEEGTVVARYDERPSPCAKRTFKPLNRLHIQVVRWLVEQEEVWICDHQSRKGDARLLTTREELRRLAVARSWEAETTQCGGDAIINRVTLKRIKSLSSRRILWACRTTANLSSVQLSCNAGDLLCPTAHRLGERCRLKQFRIM